MMKSTGDMFELWIQQLYQRKPNVITIMVEILRYYKSSERNNILGRSTQFLKALTDIFATVLLPELWKV